MQSLTLTLTLTHMHREILQMWINKKNANICISTQMYMMVYEKKQACRCDTCTHTCTCGSGVMADPHRGLNFSHFEADQPASAVGSPSDRLGGLVRFPPLR